MSVGRDIDESVGLSIVTATGNAPKFAGDDTSHDVDVLLSTRNDVNRLSPGMYEAARQWDSRAAVYKKNDQAFVEQKNGAVVRRLVGYGRFDGVETTRVLERLYAASRLHTNFFQPSFKLKDKRREGAKVIKRYHVPATPYERALAHPKVSKAVKRRLRELYRTLDPVALLAEMRDAQAELGTRVGARAGKLAAATSPPAPTTNPAAFAKGLGNDVHLGEQRIIHRRMRKPYKKRMRMPSMLDPHLADIERWLASEPRLTALAILGRLAEHCSERFGPSQHTIVQRLLRSLRCKAAETIIPRTAEGAAPDGDPGTGGDAACDGHSATPPAPPIRRSLTKPRTGRPSALYPSSESNILRSKLSQSQCSAPIHNLIGRPPFGQRP